MIAIGISSVMFSINSDGNTTDAGRFARKEDADMEQDDDQGLDPGKGTQTIKL